MNVLPAVNGSALWCVLYTSNFLSADCMTVTQRRRCLDSPPAGAGRGALDEGILLAGGGNPTELGGHMQGLSSGLLLGGSNTVDKPRGSCQSQRHHLESGVALSDSRILTSVACRVGEEPGTASGTTSGLSNGRGYCEACAGCPT